MLFSLLSDLSHKFLWIPSLSIQPLLIINKMLINLVRPENLTPHKPILLIKPHRLPHSLTRLRPQNPPFMLPRNIFQPLQNRLRNSPTCTPSPLRHNIHPLHLRLPQQSLFSERAQATTTYGLATIVGYEEDWDVGGACWDAEACGAESGDFELLGGAEGGGVWVRVRKMLDGEGRHGVG